MGKSRPPKVHRYSMHFKATAVRLSELPDVLIQDVAEALDIHPFMLSRWRKQASEGLIVTKGGFDLPLLGRGDGQVLAAYCGLGVRAAEECTADFACARSSGG